MSTPYWHLLPYVRVYVGDLTGETYTDDTLILVLQVTTAVLALLGYDKGYSDDPSGLNVTLNAKEKALWGKAAAVLLQDPEGMKAALDAVSVRTLGTAYSTEGRARLLESSTSRAFASLRAVILSMVEPARIPLDNLDIDTLP